MNALGCNISEHFYIQHRMFKTLEKKPFENIVGKGENAGNKFSSTVKPVLETTCFEQSTSLTLSSIYPHVSAVLKKKSHRKTSW